MFIYLLQAQHKNDKVAIEVHEDVSVEKNDGSMLVEQITSSQDTNPITDDHEKFWKTLANWIQGVEDKVYAPQTTSFTLYVLQKRTPGKLIKKFIAATDLASAKKALVEAKAYFWGAAPAYSKKATVPANKKGHLEKIFSYDENTVAEIIKNFSLKVGTGNVDDDIQEGLSNLHYKPLRAQDFKMYMLGALSVITQSHISKKERAVIARESPLFYSLFFFYEFKFI